MRPAVVGAWRTHFERYPIDGAERVLSRLVRIQLEPDPGDEVVRPWAYSAAQAARARREREAVLDSRRQEAADRRLTAFMMR